MATKSWRQVPTLKGQLLADPTRFEFHQAVKLVESFYAYEVPLGEGISPEKEALSIKSRVYFSAPPSDIYEIDFDAANNNDRVTIHVNFLGLAGLQGPLPTPYTQEILDRIKSKDYATRDFLDLFNHRLISILHRIRKKNWVGLDNKRAHETQIGQSLMAINGTLSPISQSRNISHNDLLAYSGLMWQSHRSAAGLKQSLSHFFGTKVAIESNKGGWEKLDHHTWTYLGHGSHGKNNTLGQDAMLGKRYWNVEKNIGLVIGPLDFKTFETFLKNGKSYGQIMELTQAYLPQGYKFSLRFKVKGKEVRPTHLDGKSYLGWTSWLLSKPKTVDDDQVILYPSF